MANKVKQPDSVSTKSKIQGTLSYLWGVIVSNIVWLTILSIPSSIWGIKYIVAAVSAITAGGSVPIHILIISGICTLICLFSLLGVAVFFLYNLLHKEQPPFPSLESAYKLTRMDCELFFQDREHILQRLTVHFEVTAESLEAIPHTMHWTGSGYKPSTLVEKSLAKGYSMREKKRSASTFSFEVVFPEKKEKGYSDSYSFETVVEDAKHVMLPSLSWLIKCESEELILKVTAPPGIIQSCEQLISVDFPCDFILSEPQPVEPELVGNHHCYKYSFTDLQLLRYYMLRWEWTDTETNSN